MSYRTLLRPLSAQAVRKLTANVSCELVSIQNGLVTIIWSSALLIALAAAVRFFPALFVSGCAY